jgi:hypothetical protein
VVRVEGLQLHQRYITILDKHTNQEVVGVIELVSPTNKVRGPGRRSYLEKQRQVLKTTAHLVEIDLIRTGKHVLAVPENVAGQYGPYHYLACVNRATEDRDEFDLYPRKLSERLPKIRIPLAKGDPDVVLDVQAVMEQTYADGAYDDRIEYNKPCIPPLSEEDQAWANRILKKAGFHPTNRTKKQK